MAPSFAAKMSLDPRWKASVLKDGKYSVYFRTPLAEGLGVVVLAPDGKLSGGDTVMTYTGHWRTDGEQFEATLFTSRHSAGEPPAFGGIDDLDITLTGRSKGEVTASCKGTAKQAPGLMLDATLVRTADE
jgi:T3SS negative regulator,GrlR